MLDELRKDEFYPRLGVFATHAIAALYIALALVSGVYMHIEYFAIETVRAGVWTTTDLVMGAIMVVLIMEYARKRYFVIFVLNVALILYAVYGWIVPGLFGHPGLSWTRVTSAMSVDAVIHGTKKWSTNAIAATTSTIATIRRMKIVVAVPSA